MRGLYTTLLHKYYVDEIYAALIVKPLLWHSTNVLWQKVDAGAIDGTVNGIAEGLSGIGDGVRHTQSGNTRSYAVWVVIGALVIIAIIFWPYVRPTTVGVVR
jgi:NADH-quinone oxidoreductase subunit L